MKEQAKHYGKYALTGAVGIGLGFTAFTVNDTPTKQTDTYQNLQDKLDTAQNNADDFESQVADLQTTVTDKEDRIANLTSQVSQFETTVQELKEENEDLEDAVAQGDERVGIVDYFPVFTQNTDVEYDNFNVESVDDPADDLNGVTDAEGDYTQIDVETVDPNEDHEYDATVVEFEDGEDADEYEEHQRDYVDEVSFSANGETQTVGITAKDNTGATGALDNVLVTYEDDDVLRDVEDEDDIESVVVDGDDVTEDVTGVSVSSQSDGERLNVKLNGDTYVNEGDEVSVTFESDSEEAPEFVQLNHGNNYEYEYDQDADQFVFRDGNTVVTGEGIEDSDGDEDDYDAQYEEFTTQYE